MLDTPIERRGDLNRAVRRADDNTMSRHWIAPLVAASVAAGFVVAYLLADGAPAAEWLTVAAPALTALAALTVAAMRPVRIVPPLVLSAGFALMTVATWWAVVDLDRGTLVFPGDPAAVLVLAYPALIAATIAMTSRQRNSPDPLGGSEPIMYTIAVTALVWVAVTGPQFDGDGFPLRDQAWVWIFPLLDAVLAMLALRRMTTHDGARFQLMTLGFLLLGAGHAAIGWAAYDGRLEPGSWEAIAPAVGCIVLALAISRPVTTAPSGDAANVHWTQVFGLFVAALVPLGVLVLMLATGLASRSSSIVVSVATVAVIVFALVRMWHLVHQVQILSEQRGRDRLAAMVEHSSDVVMLADADGKVNYASPGLRAMLGHDPESWAGRDLVDVVVEDERDGARRHLDRVIEHGPGGTVEFEVTLVHLDGQLRKAVVVIANLVGGSAVDGIVATFRDVTDQRNLERQLSHRAFHDELTGLANRALFLDRMDHALRVARHEVDPVVVLFIDLDDFKRVNDEHGHAVGDRVLKAIADRIRRAASSGDTVARLGGDEFALLLEDRGGIDRAIDVAERLLETLREPLTIANEEVAVLASVGVAVATSGMSTTGLLRDADIAMYEAKRAGKGQIRIFDPAMRLVATKHLEYRGDLADAVERDQLRLVYMPYVDLASGQVVGAEALIRWRHPVHGDIPASEFVPIAERSGLIVPIGEWAMGQAFAHASTWRAGLLLSMNVSPVQIRQPDFVDRLVDLIDVHRLDPSSVVFELTEAVLDDDAGRAGSTIARLREEGFRFAIDDFGAGQCSIASLQRQPVDLLKIDRVAVKAFGSDPHGQTLAKTILQMAAALDLVTVAEGIETTSQLRELRRLGCDLGQGYLLSHPVERSELEQRFGHPGFALPAEPPEPDDPAGDATQPVVDQR